MFMYSTHSDWHKSKDTDVNRTIDKISIVLKNSYTYCVSNLFIFVCVQYGGGTVLHVLETTTDASELYPRCPGKMANLDTEGMCYKNEGFVENEPRGSSDASFQASSDPYPLIAITILEGDPIPEAPSSPTFSCKTQSSVLSLDTPTCRICQDHKAKERLVSPCGCLGSSKFVHRRCLQKWITLKGATECEICQKPYDRKVTNGPCFTPSEENTVASSIVVLLVLLGIIGVGIFLLVNHLTYYHSKMVVSIWVPVSLLFVGALGLSVFLPWLALFCIRTSRRHRVGDDAPLTQFH